MQDALAHDEKILPHQYGQRERDKMFPKICAPKSIDNDDDWSPGENDQSWNHEGVDEKMSEAEGSSRAMTAGRRPLSRARATARWPPGSRSE